MDDYAHHPRELAAAITSVKKMFPGRRLTALFQPHLYTRTRDFYREFAEALSQPINPGNKKVIIFTAFSDTAEYLFTNISAYAKEN